MMKYLYRLLSLAQRVLNILKIFFGGSRGRVMVFHEIFKDSSCEQNSCCCSLHFLESSAVATGLEKVSFHSNPKERQCQRMLKLPHNCTHFRCQQSNAQISPSQAPTVCEPRTSRCSSWIQKTQKNQKSNCQHTLDHRKSKRIPEKYLLLLH